MILGKINRRRVYPTKSGNGGSTCLPPGTVLYESGEQINVVHEPTSGIVSMLCAKYEIPAPTRRL